MNKDIRLLTTFPRHPKTIKLKRILGTWEPVIVLWLWAAENKPSGELCDMEDEDIAIASNWSSEPSKLIDALLKVRFLEKTKKGAYRLHGWREKNAYAANAEKRSEKARLAAQARWDKKLKQCSSNAKTCSEHARSNAPTPNPSPSPKVYSDKLTEFVRNYINYVKNKYPTQSPRTKNLEARSLDTIDKLIRLNGFKEDFIFKALRWAQKNDFWATKVYSLAGLRKKSDDGCIKFQNLAAAYKQDNPESTKRIVSTITVNPDDRC